jgi:dolichyl-phosphate-mannose-protein mannosyltransferase
MKRAAQWFRDTTSSIRQDAPLAVIVLATLVVGVYLRLYDIHLPTFLRWDEHHYVNVARSYVSREYNTDDHPPFGKLIIAGFMRVLGDNPLGWRMASEVFGFINIGLVAWAAWAVFGSRRAGVLAAAFVAIDGFFIAYSRAALLDGMIVAFSLAAVTTMLCARRWWHVLLAGVLAGGAASFKLNGVPILMAVLMICAASRRWRRLTPVVLGLAALVFYGQSAAALVLTGKSGSVLAVIAENRKLINHHLSYTVVHPFSSHWYTWFVPIRPILLRRDVDADQTARALLTLGNPLLWWGSTAAVIAGLIVLARVGPRRLWEMVQAHGSLRPAGMAGPAVPLPGGAAGAGQPGRGGVLAVADRAAWLVGILLGWAGPLAFWVPSLRDAYIYHYFPSYTFALILLAGFTDRFYDRRRLLTLAAILVVVEVSMFYAPVWGEFPISEAALHVRLFPFWR